MQILTQTQYDDAWWKARRGMPTASEAGRILTPGGKPSQSKSGGASSYIYELIGDIYDTAYPRVNEYQSPAMKNGSEKESEALSLYAFTKGVDLVRVGLCCDESGRFGFSPDALVGKEGDWEGAIEAKNPLPKTHIQWLMDGVVPQDHIPQVHFTLIASGCEWVDFVSNCYPLPELIVRVTPDDYTAKMREQMEKFWDELQETKRRIDEMKRPTAYLEHIDEIETAKVF